MNVNDFGHVSIVFEYDMMCARVYRVKCFNFSNIRIRIRTDFYIKIRIRRMRILINSVTSLTVCILYGSRFVEQQRKQDVQSLYPRNMQRDWLEEQVNDGIDGIEMR